MGNAGFISSTVVLSPDPGTSLTKPVAGYWDKGWESSKLSSGRMKLTIWPSLVQLSEFSTVCGDNLFLKCQGCLAGLPHLPSPNIPADTREFSAYGQPHLFKSLSYSTYRERFMQPNNEIEYTFRTSSIDEQGPGRSKGSRSKQRQ